MDTNAAHLIFHQNNYMIEVVLSRHSRLSYILLFVWLIECVFVGCHVISATGISLIKIVQFIHEYMFNNGEL